MGRQTGQKLSGLQAPGLRRALLMFLALAYLFVGLAHTFTCADETIASAVAANIGTASGDGSDEGGTQKSQGVAEHCHVCAPVLMPAFIPDAEPSARSLELSFIAPVTLLDDGPRLDTPPPKHLI